MGSNLPRAVEKLTNSDVQAAFNAVPALKLVRGSAVGSKDVAVGYLVADMLDEPLPRRADAERAGKRYATHLSSVAGRAAAIEKAATARARAARARADGAGQGPGAAGCCAVEPAVEPAQTLEAVECEKEAALAALWAEPYVPKQAGVKPSSAKPQLDAGASAEHEPDGAGDARSWSEHWCSEEESSSDVMAREMRKAHEVRARVAAEVARRATMEETSAGQLKLLNEDTELRISLAFNRMQRQAHVAKDLVLGAELSAASNYREVARCWKLYAEHAEALAKDLWQELGHAQAEIAKLGGTVDERGAWLQEYAGEKLEDKLYDHLPVEWS